MHDIAAKVGTTRAKHGVFKFFTRDEWIGRSLHAFGEWSEDELELMKRCIQPNDVAIDIGANIGAFTVPMSRLAKRVIALEPHPDTFALLCDNLAANGRYNVDAFPFAASDRCGKAFMPPSDGLLNPAGFAVDEVGEVEIDTSTLDVFDFERVDFIKIDAEGHELKVLKGARKTIDRCRPILYVENDRLDKSVELVGYIVEQLRYRCYWHRIPLFNPANFKKEKENPYGQTISLMMLCIPEEKTGTHKVRRLDEVADIRSDDQTYQREIDRYERYLEIDPGDLEARLLVAHYSNLQQDTKKAWAMIEENLKIDATHFGTRAIRGLLRLQRGDYEQGWQDYELRYEKENSALFGNRPHHGSHWDGQPTDKPLLIWCEQGFGDSIMFGRFMADVLEGSPNAFLEVQPQLFELFEQSHIVPDGRLFRKGRRLPHYDLHCSLPSLPATLKLGGDLARRVPYLFPEPNMQRTWREREHPRIGICWKGNKHSERCYSRDIEFDMFNAISSKHSILSLLDDGQFESWADTAAALSELDLVISVDTAMAHLAGAMGKRTWLALSYDPDFRWGLNGDTCVWYPTMKIFRQPNLFDWESVIARMTEELETLDIKGF